MDNRVRSRIPGTAILIGAVVAMGPVWVNAQECEPGWSALGEVGVGATALSQVVFDDGRGPALYAGGIAYDGIFRRGLARWDGQSWELLDVSSLVNSMAVFDDGFGPALYAGGNFGVLADRSISGFAKWDGGRWTAVGDHHPTFPEAMAVYDDGNGAALYVAGWTRDPATGRSESLARWDATQWSFLGEGSVDGQVLALTVYDEGGGPMLVVGGIFTTAGGQPTNYVARWDGANWWPMGDGVPGKVTAFAVHDDGQRQTLYAAGGIMPRRWHPESQTWERLGESFAGGHIEALEVFDDGRGLALYATGGFDTMDGQSLPGLARWDGASWSAVGEGIEARTGYSLGTFDDGHGPSLYIGGMLSIDGDFHGIARWGCDAPCRADLDRDCELTIFDFLAFQNLYDAGDPQADFDGDGALTIFDFLAFQDVFGAGCP